MRILVVEDEARIAMAIKKGLEQEKFAVDVAHDGESGFDLASTEEYAVIVLDLLLPGMDGVQICKKLREMKNHTPILMLTAKGQIEDKVGGLNAGADDYMTKPFSFEELLARIKALSRRTKSGVEMVLQAGDLALDTVRSEVRRGGQTITLSAKEYALLNLLMVNKNKVMKKDDIIRQIWDFDADVLPNTVEVYIRNLRNKIDEPFKNKPALIKTIRGFGYKIEG